MWRVPCGEPEDPLEILPLGFLLCKYPPTTQAASLQHRNTAFSPVAVHFQEPCLGSETRADACAA